MSVTGRGAGGGGFYLLKPNQNTLIKTRSSNHLLLLSCF